MKQQQGARGVGSWYFKKIVRDVTTISTLVATNKAKHNKH
jgi:hypothetical protein